MAAIYLGDGLYADFNGAAIVLTTDRGIESVLAPTINWVALEPEVFESLLQFAIKIGWLTKDKYSNER